MTQPLPVETHVCFYDAMQFARWCALTTGKPYEVHKAFQHHSGRLLLVTGRAFVALPQASGDILPSCMATAWEDGSSCIYVQPTPELN